MLAEHQTETEKPIIYITVYHFPSKNKLLQSRPQTQVLFCLRPNNILATSLIAKVAR